MPDKLTDNEIVKALECCQNKNGYDCDDCPYQEIKHFDKEKGFEITPNGMTYDTLSCDIWLQKDTLDLINRLQARVEKAEKVEHFADKTIATLQAEIERLKNHIQEGIDLAKQIPEMVSLSKAEAYKEFAEEFNKKIFPLGMYHDMNYSINAKAVKVACDKALNELVGENDG